MPYWSRVEIVSHTRALPHTSNELRMSMDRTVKPMRSTREKQVLLLAHWFSGGLCQTCTALAAQRAGCPGFSEG